ncbi:MAG: hypothetical protein BWY96_01650 [Spirochaetes bacterium ADurb.BinA120]|nr:MAG: hypothetical protein BWY96_01650 [Spirochaetes bacterium ADurb.BinA120]HPV98989.1 hypothetical protein [Spirochaetota bacterium]
MRLHPAVGISINPLWGWRRAPGALGSRVADYPTGSMRPKPSLGVAQSAGGVAFIDSSTQMKPYGSSLSYPAAFACSSLSKSMRSSGR